MAKVMESHGFAYRRSDRRQPLPATEIAPEQRAALGRGEDESVCPRRPRSQMSSQLLGEELG
jgi:hypothetical protein